MDPDEGAYLVWELVQFVDMDDSHLEELCEDHGITVDDFREYVYDNYDDLPWDSFT